MTNSQSSDPFKHKNVGKILPLENRYSPGNYFNLICIAWNKDGSSWAVTRGDKRGFPHSAPHAHWNSIGLYVGKKL